MNALKTDGAVVTDDGVAQRQEELARAAALGQQTDDLVDRLLEQPVGASLPYGAVRLTDGRVIAAGQFARSK